MNTLKCDADDRAIESRMTQCRVRVVLADDHPVYRSGLADTIRLRPDLELVAEASDGAEAMARIQALRPDVAVLDLKMPGLDGISVLRAVVRENVPTKVLFVSAFVESDLAYEALGHGASGYMSKGSTGPAICDAIAAVAQGQPAVTPEVQSALIGEIRARTPDDNVRLSPREVEVLRRTADGSSAAEIAEAMALAPTTIKTHLQRSYQKLAVSDRAAAVAEAIRRGILE